MIAHDLPLDTDALGPDPDLSTALRAARRAARTGSPEAQLVMSSRINGHGTAAVILRHVGSVDATQVAAIVEDIARAFDIDPAGFNQLELSLCPWQDDVSSALAAACQESASTIVLDPAHRVPATFFRDLKSKPERASRPLANSSTPSDVICFETSSSSLREHSSSSPLRLF